MFYDMARWMRLDAHWELQVGGRTSINIIFPIACILNVQEIESPGIQYNFPRLNTESHRHRKMKFSANCAIVLCAFAFALSTTGAWETYDDPYKGWTLQMNETSTLQCTGSVQAHASAHCNECTKGSALESGLDVYANCTETYAEVHTFPSMDGKCTGPSIPVHFPYGCISGQLTAIVPPPSDTEDEEKETVTAVH